MGYILAEVKTAAMAGRYVPPHLRNRGGSNDTGTSVGNREEHPGSGEYALQDLAHHYETEGHNTLNSSMNDPTTITHILIFKSGHPDWPPKIYCKSNLDLLDGYRAPAGSDSNVRGSDQPAQDASVEPSVPVFVERRRDTFGFAGFYNVASISYLEPRSEALVALFETKFKRGESTKERRPELWKQSLGMRWAMVTLVPDDARAGERCGVVKPPPKSVTEQLEEMRLWDKERADASKTQATKAEALDPERQSSSSKVHGVAEDTDKTESGAIHVLNPEAQSPPVT